MRSEAEKYVEAEHGKQMGWRCFHCGEYFGPNQRADAANHFGTNEDQESACKIATGEGTPHGLVIYIRDLERRLHDYQNESDPVSRYWYDITTKHRTEVIAAEQSGYDKGLKDGTARRALPDGDKESPEAEA